MLDAKNNELSDAKLTHAAQIQTIRTSETDAQRKVTDAEAQHSAALKARDDALIDEKSRFHTKLDKELEEVLSSEKSKAEKLESDFKDTKQKLEKMESDFKDAEQKLEKLESDIKQLEG